MKEKSAIDYCIVLYYLAKKSVLVPKVHSYIVFMDLQTAFNTIPVVAHDINVDMEPKLLC